MSSDRSIYAVAKVLSLCLRSPRSTPFPRSTACVSLSIILSRTTSMLGIARLPSFQRMDRGDFSLIQVSLVETSECSYLHKLKLPVLSPDYAKSMLIVSTCLAQELVEHVGLGFHLVGR